VRSPFRPAVTNIDARRGEGLRAVGGGDRRVLSGKRRMARLFRHPQTKDRETDILSQFHFCGAHENRPQRTRRSLRTLPTPSLIRNRVT
jgi:hypothetical protein